MTKRKPLHWLATLPHLTIVDDNLLCKLFEALFTHKKIDSLKPISHFYFKYLLGNNNVHKSTELISSSSLITAFQCLLFLKIWTPASKFALMLVKEIDFFSFLACQI